MNSPSYIVPILLAAVALIGYVALIAKDISGLWRTSSQFNATEDWTEVPQHGQEPAPMATPLSDWCGRVIARHIETDETLEGFARALFSPPRPRDWGIKVGLDKVPLLVAVTSRRIIFLEMGYRTVRRTCSIRLDAIRFLIPPKPGILDTTGKLRFGLRSGREYQIAFHSPLLSDEGMRQERRLAAYLHSIAPRFESSPASDSLAA